MTVLSWYAKVQKSGTLTVAKGTKLKGGAWTTAFEKSIDIFNQLMTDNGITLQLTKVDDANANVIVDTANGKTNFQFQGGTYTEDVPGNGLHGATKPMAVQYGNKPPQIEQAFVFVPVTPRIDPRNKRSREAGPEVGHFILVHEFIHAAGLSNGEHTNDDVFCYPGEVANSDSAATDKIQPWGGLGKPAPPYTLIAKTIANLKKAWP